MKKCLFSLTFILIVMQSFAQAPTPSPALSKDEYLLKGKHQKSIAWVMLGGGITLMTLGVAIASAQTLTDALGGQTSKGTGANILAYTGLAAAVGSIPLFISAGKNRRKAVALSFKNQQLVAPQQTTFVLKQQPTLTLKIAL